MNALAFISRSALAATLGALGSSSGLGADGQYIPADSTSATGVSVRVRVAPGARMARMERRPPAGGNAAARIRRRGVLTALLPLSGESATGGATPSGSIVELRAGDRIRLPAEHLGEAGDPIWVSVVEDVRPTAGSHVIASVEW